MVPSGAIATEAQKTEPDKNTYLVLKGWSVGPRFELRLRHALPLPGTRGRRDRQRGEAGIDHARQPRRRHRPSRDAAGDARHERPTDRDDRRLDVGSLRAAAPPD